MTPMARKVSERRMPNAPPQRAGAAPSSAALSRSASNQGLSTLFRMANAAQAEAPPIVHEVLRSPGRPLDAGVRNDMEHRFGGADFGNVRVHTDSKAADSAEAVNARAYTVGSDLVMGRGQTAQAVSPLLAHELAHTLQSSPTQSISPRGTGLFRTCAANPSETFYSGAPNYCTDTGFSGSLHPGQRCYREVPVRSDYFDCPPGDQVCFDDDGNCHDSYDLVSTVESKDADGGCNLHGYCFGGHATDDIIPGLTDIALAPFKEWYSDLDCSIRQLYGAPC